MSFQTGFARRAVTYNEASDPLFGTLGRSQPVMTKVESLSEDQLMHLIDRIDRDDFSKGVEPKSRSFNVAKRVMEECGVAFRLGGNRDPALARFQAAYRKFYRPRDIEVGAVNAGLAVHLDLFFSVRMPLVFGSVSVDPFNWTDMTDFQRARLRPEEAEKILSQIIDVVDIGGVLAPLGKYKQPPECAVSFFSMAAFHNQASAAICTSGFAYRGAIMASLTCAELATKSLVLANGRPESELKHVINHNLQNARPDLEALGSLDVDNFLSLAKNLPPFVGSRYLHRNWSRLECADVVLSAQKMLAMAARNFSGYSIESALTKG